MKTAMNGMKQITKRNMGLLALLMTLGPLGLFACGGSGGDDSCTSTADCITGFACDENGQCVARDPLAITTESLHEGVVGVEYAKTLQAEGGVQGYSWALNSKPAWLSVGADTGVLSGTPSEAVEEVLVEVVVTDASLGGGESLSKNFYLSVVTCVEGAPQPCYTAEEGKCLVGNRTCSGGEWGACSNTIHSSLVDHCGADCEPCDQAVADSCRLGSCTCGDGPACAGGAICCLGECLDPLADDGNCGACGHACADAVLNAENPHCENGRCEFDDCHPDYLDGDEDRSNGCEMRRDVDNCEYAGVACSEVAQNATGFSCVFDDGLGQYRCEYETCDLGFHDCDGQRGNGCETVADTENCHACGDNCGSSADGRECVFDADLADYRCGCTHYNFCDTVVAESCCGQLCRARDDPEFCGHCDTSCVDDPAGPVCVVPYDHICGCNEHADCGPGSICCDQACMPNDPENCGECGHLCDPYLDSGSVCDLANGSCLCEDDSQCNDMAGGQQNCSDMNQTCRCGSGGVEGCTGGVGSQCCGDGAAADCANVMTDEENCGRCGIVCEPAMGCISGACECVFGVTNCPRSSPAPDCTHADLCTCFDSPNGGPCGDGRICCAGDSAGTGGPDEGPDLGCCLNDCGQNLSGECDF